MGLEEIQLLGTFLQMILLDLQVVVNYVVLQIILLI